MSELIIGPDVSEYSGAIDWAKVAGCRFALARIGTTKTPTDSRFEHNWSGIGHRGSNDVDELIRHGMRRGGYWFAYPEVSEKGRDGKADAERCIRTLRRAPGSVRDTDLIVFDVEDQGGARPDPRWAKLSRPERIHFADAWMATIEDHLQRRGLVYGGQYFFQDLFGHGYKPRGWKTMVSYYNAHPDWLNTPFVERMLLWQHAGDGVGASPRRVEGIGADVDVSRVMHASLESFMRYGNKR